MTQRKGEAARAHWRKLVADQAESGQTAAAFCRARGTWPSSFFKWKRKLAGTAAEAEFVELRPAVRAGAPGMVVELRGGRRLRVERGFDRELLVELIAALEERE